MPRSTPMATVATQLSLESQLHERFRYSGIDRENLSDLVNIAVSLRNKYGITPVAAVAQGSPMPDRIVIRYLIEGTTLNKLANILLDTPRLTALQAMPHGMPHLAKFEVSITLGG